MEVRMSESMNIEQVVDGCVDYWKDTGVDPQAVAEMRTELESHLHEAAAAGKPLESVVGPDLEVFAEAWAVEARGSAHREHPVEMAPPAHAPHPRQKSRSGAGIGVFAIAGVALVAALAVFGPKESGEMDMAVWQWLWSVATVLLGIGEMLTAGFFLLPFAIGAAAAAVLAFFNVAVPLQIVTFLAVSVASLWTMNKYARKEDENTLPVGATWYINATAMVIEDIDPAQGTGQVRVETEQWRATTDIGRGIAAGTRVRVAEVRGARLVVEPMEF